MPAWVASAVERRVELWDTPLALLPALAARAAVPAYGDELLDRHLPGLNDKWRAPGGRDFAADSLLHRAEAAPRQELQRLVEAAKKAREELPARAVTTRELAAGQNSSLAHVFRVSLEEPSTTQQLILGSTARRAATSCSGMRAALQPRAAEWQGDSAPHAAQPAEQTAAAFRGARRY